MPADHDDRPMPVELERLEAGKAIDLGCGEGAEVERRPETHGALRDALCGADIEQLHRLARVEAPGELIGRNLRDRGARHGDERRRGRAEMQPAPRLARPAVLPLAGLLWTRSQAT